MSEISPVYTSTAKKQRYGPHRPWHTSQAPEKPRTDGPANLPRWDTAGMYALPEFEQGYRTERPKLRQQPDDVWRPIAQWWEAVASLNGRPLHVSITAAVHNTGNIADKDGRTLNDKIIESLQQHMSTGNVAVETSYHQFIRAQDAAIAECKRRSKVNPDAGKSSFAEPPQPRIWKR